MKPSYFQYLLKFIKFFVKNRKNEPSYFQYLLKFIKFTEHFWLFVLKLCCFEHLQWTTKISQKARFSAVNSKQILIETKQLPCFT